MLDTNSLAIDAGGPTVLCIDDDPDIPEAIATRLQQYDVEVLRAYHGMHGLWLAKTQRPDVIITDVRMPQGSGHYIIECLRTNPETAKIPIILLTGQRDPGLEALARRFEIDVFLNKPVRFNDLASAIRKFIPLSQRRPTADATQA